MVSQKKNCKNNKKNILGAQIFMCGLEIAEFESVSRENQLILSQLPIPTLKDIRMSKAIHLLQQLIIHSVYSLTYDPVAASYFLTDKFFTFECDRVKCEIEQPYEGQLVKVEDDSKEGGRIYWGKSLNKQEYFEFIKNQLTVID